MFTSIPAIHRTTSWIAAFVRDDAGVDLVEYALLSALIGLTGLVLFNLTARMGTAYSNWNTNGQTQWKPCPPASSGLSCP